MTKSKRSMREKQSRKAKRYRVSSERRVRTIKALHQKGEISMQDIKQAVLDVASKAS